MRRYMISVPPPPEESFDADDRRRRGEEAFTFVRFAVVTRARYFL